MKRELLKPPAFIRDLRRWLKQHPKSAASVGATLSAMSEDAHQPALDTHKLKGKLSQYWASSAGYNTRVVFEFLMHDGAEVIRLVTIGTHDDVYN